MLSHKMQYMCKRCVALIRSLASFGLGKCFFFVCMCPCWSVTFRKSLDIMQPFSISILCATVRPNREKDRERERAKQESNRERRALKKKKKTALHSIAEIIAMQQILVLYRKRLQQCHHRFFKQIGFCLVRVGSHQHDYIMAHDFSGTWDGNDGAMWDTDRFVADQRTSNGTGSENYYFILNVLQTII